MSSHSNNQISLKTDDYNDNSEIVELCEIAFLHPDYSDMAEETTDIVDFPQSVGEYDDEESESDPHWTHKAIELLISHRIRMDKMFKNPKQPNQALWDRISKYIKSDHFDHSPRDCRVKYHKMLSLYKHYVEMNQTAEKSSEKWPWFNVFHNAVNYTPPICSVPAHLLASTLDDDYQPEFKKPRNYVPKFIREGRTAPLRKSPIPKKTRDDAHEVEENQKVVEKGEVNYAREVKEEDDERRETDSKWNSAKTNLFLKLRLEMASSFNDRRKNRYILWKQIADRMSKANYYCTPRDLAVKFKNLNLSFRRIKARLEEDDTASTTWDWYNQMYDIYTKMKTEESPVKCKDSASSSDYKGEEDGYSSESSVSSDNGFVKTTVNPLDFDNIDNIDNIDEYNEDTKIHIRSADDMNWYYKERIKIDLMAEERKSLMWKEQKEIEIKKLAVKKQQVQVCHRIAVALENLVQNPFMKRFCK